MEFTENLSIELLHGTSSLKSTRTPLLWQRTSENFQLSSLNIEPRGFVCEWTLVICTATVTSSVRELLVCHQTIAWIGPNYPAVQADKPSSGQERPRRMGAVDGVHYAHIINAKRDSIQRERVLKRRNATTLTTFSHRISASVLVGTFCFRMNLSAQGTSLFGRIACNSPDAGRAEQIDRGSLLDRRCAFQIETFNWNVPLNSLLL